MDVSGSQTAPYFLKLSFRDINPLQAVFSLRYFNVLDRRRLRV
jgi:hypothetical protein